MIKPTTKYGPTTKRHKFQVGDVVKVAGRDGCFRVLGTTDYYRGRKNSGGNRYYMQELWTGEISGYHGRYCHIWTDAAVSNLVTANWERKNEEVPSH